MTIKSMYFHATVFLFYFTSHSKMTSLSIIMTTTARELQISTIGQITDIQTNISLYDNEIIQLQVSWLDNFSKATTYNIISVAENRATCSDPPCSLYGILKPDTIVKLPDNPMLFVEVRECNYMFGCNYTIVIETSNALVAGIARVSIPLCIDQVCLCQIKPPKILAYTQVLNNETINFSWSIKLNINKVDEANRSTAIAFDNIKNYRMHLKIDQQSNPSLSWGGNLIPIIEQRFGMDQLSYTKTKSGLQGHIQIPLNEQLVEMAVLNVQTYIIDQFGCAGIESIMRVKVPNFQRTVNEAISMNKAGILSNSLVLVAIILSIVVIMFGFCQFRRQLNKTKLRNANVDLKPFTSTMIDMEDNINYVDKYIEQSQTLGIADSFEVPHSAITMGPEIGEGAFGIVCKATAINLKHLRGRTTVAVKQLKRNPTAEEVAEFRCEIEMLKEVGTHQNIVCFLGCCTIRLPYIMIMEYVGRGNLLTYLRKVRQLKPNYSNCKSSRKVSEKSNLKYIELKISDQTSIAIASDKETRQPKSSFVKTTYTFVEDGTPQFEYILDNNELNNFALQIANGMQFLEEQKITHRDLAARNVLIDDDKTLKISDFGLSRHGIYTNRKTRKLPLRWLSIEAICDNIYSNKSDVWAYGVVLWEIGTLGAFPYSTISNNELIPFLLAGSRLKKPEICTDEVYELMLQCWAANPNDRPTFKALYKMLNPNTAYVHINSLSDDYVFPPITESNIVHY